MRSWSRTRSSRRNSRVYLDYKILHSLIIFFFRVCNSSLIFSELTVLHEERCVSNFFYNPPSSHDSSGAKTSVVQLLLGSTKEQLIFSWATPDIMDWAIHHHSSPKESFVKDLQCQNTWWIQKLQNWGENFALVPIPLSRAWGDPNSLSSLI